MPKGTELYALLVPLGAWSKEWARTVGVRPND